MKQKYQKVNKDISQKKYDSALKNLNSILSNNNFDIFALLKKGDILLLQNDYYGALDCFNNILELFEDNIDALVGKSKSLFGLKQYKDAFMIYNKSIELRENSVDVNYYNELFKLSEKGNLPLPVRTQAEDNKSQKSNKSSEKYIIFINNYYRVRKILNGKHKNFGSFENIENACILRDLLIKNDWNYSKIPKKYFSDHSNSKGQHGKYITFANNYYRVIKTFNGKTKFFGSFNDKNNAIVLRDLLIENGWIESGIPNEFFSDHASSKEGKYGKYIIFVNGHFGVNKHINGKRKLFGSFENIENAHRLRDLLIKNDWDKSNIPRIFLNDHTNSKKEIEFGEYIKFDYNYFRVQKTINGEEKNFGSFKDGQNAVYLRDLLIENDWDDSKIDRNFFSDYENFNNNKYAKHISRINDKFKVNKTLDGKLKFFGSFKYLGNAVRLRDLLIESNWDENAIPEELFKDYSSSNKGGEYLVCINNLYKVNKLVDGKQRYFGSFKEKSNAIRLRDLLMENNWDESNIPERFFSDYEGYKKRNRYGKNIALINKYFKVYNLIEGKRQYYGSFINVENARRLRDLLIENKWDKTKIPNKFFADHDNARVKK